MLLIKLSPAILISGAVRGVARFSESAPAAQVYELSDVITAKLIAAV